MQNHNSEKTVTTNELAQMIIKLNQKLDGIENKLGNKIDGVESRLNQKIDSVEIRLALKIETEIEGLATIVKNNFDRQEKRCIEEQQINLQKFRKLGLI